MVVALCLASYPGESFSSFRLTWNILTFVFKLLLHVTFTTNDTSEPLNLVFAVMALFIIIVLQLTGKEKRQVKYEDAWRLFAPSFYLFRIQKCQSSCRNTCNNQQASASPPRSSSASSISKTNSPAGNRNSATSLKISFVLVVLLPFIYNMAFELPFMLTWRSMT